MTTRRRFLSTSIAASLSLPFQRIFASSLPKAATAKPILIDSHVHVFKRDAEFPYAKGARIPAEDAPVETLIKLMQANGVARTVLIQMIVYRWDNGYLASVLKDYPTLFQGVCRVNPEDPAAPDHLSELTETGFRGVRLSPYNGAEDNWIRGPLMPPLWRRCAQLKVPMTILTSPERLPDLKPHIEANPDLTVVIDHMTDCPLNRPDLLQHLLDLARYPTVFIKISDMSTVSKQPFPYLDAQAEVKRVYEHFGAKRLMWATNWPTLKELPYAKAVELYRDRINFFSPEDHEEILYKTVQRVWPFGLA
ncbi:MAG TPA: amidohydrolase family protein [Acidobacteriaceae bacterium]|nr:amidohydrolase family protein [Acidobacteriaceae bacterium]